MRFPVEIAKPTNDPDFEDMCVEVYGVVFGDPTPKKNGRRGQKQGGVDVFANSQEGRVGIQCKRYTSGRLRFDHVVAEVDAADKAGTAIVRLILATTADNDAKLTKEVQAYSDERRSQGKYPVEVEFWGDITNRINEHPVLQEKYSPNAPGGLFHRLTVQGDEHNEKLHQLAADLQQLLAVTKKQSSIADDGVLPTARPDSANRIITQQLDRINVLIKATRYREAMSMIEAIGQDMELFDVHQKARWFVQRGVCTTHLSSANAGFKDMIAGADMYPDDDKMAAAKVRGLILKGDMDAAITAGEDACQHFPMSISAWSAAAHARMLSGEAIAAEDVPPQFADDPEVLQLLSWSAWKRSEYRVALEFGLQALDAPGAGFYSKSAALTAVLAVACEDPVARSYDMLPATVTNALRRVVQSFEPRTECFWSNQSAAALPDETAKLAYAHVLLGEPDVALRILDESAAHVTETPRMLSVRFEALRAQKNAAQFLALAQQKIDLIEPQAFMLIAEVGANEGSPEIIKALLARTTSADDEKSELNSLYWLALYRSGDKEAALTEINGADLTSEISAVTVMNGIRILLACDRREESDALLVRVAGMVPDTAPVELRMFLADLYYASRKFLDAASIFEQYAPVDRYSDLHKRLLRSYIHSGQRMRARQLLDRFPEGWSEDDEARSLAIELANLAGDWNRLLPLAQKEVEIAPDRASSWLLRLYVEVRAKPSASVIQLLEAVPKSLKGTHRQIIQTAAMEMRFGQVRKGMVRLYQLLRANMEVAEVNEGYLMCILMHSGELPWMENQLQIVAPGSSVVLEDPFGQTTEISIDPLEAGRLPQHPSFFPTTDKHVAALIGCAVGDEVDIQAGLGMTQRLKILSISTSYRRLLHLTQERAHRTFGGLPNVTSVQIIKKDGELDLQLMHQMLKKRREYVETIFTTYQEQPITLGIVAKVLGVSPIDLVTGWPSGGDKLLHVFDGSNAAQMRAERAFESPDVAVVIDLATLTELVHLDCEAALASVSKVYVSASVPNALAELRSEAENDRSMGTAVDIDGRLQIHEFNDEHRSRRIGLLDRLQAAIDRYCEVCPAYGGHEIPTSVANLVGLLGEDEYEALLLAHERKAILLSLDQRLRTFAAESSGIDGAWTQVFLAYALRKKMISLKQYFSACALQLRTQRTSVWLSGELILWMCTQSQAALEDTVTRFKGYLATSTSELIAGVDVLIEFLYRLCARGTNTRTVKAFTDEFAEAICRNRQFNELVFGYLRKGIGEFVNGLGTADSGIEPYDRPNAEYRRRLFEFLDQTLSEARERADAPEVLRPLPLVVMYTAKLPAIVWRDLPVAVGDGAD